MSVELDEKPGPGMARSALVITPVTPADRDVVASAGVTLLGIYADSDHGGLEFLADGWADLGIVSIHFARGGSHRVDDQSPLLFLRDSLRRLSGLGFGRMNIDLAAFPRLENVEIEWSRGAESLFDCTGLRYLSLHRCPDEDLSRLHRLKNLEELAIVSRRLRRLNGISALKRLWHVDLYGCPKLENTEGSLGELRQLPHLTYLEIEACKEITNVDVIATIPGLQKLNVVNNRGTLASLLPLQRHPALRDIYWESTKIEDGDMTPLLDIPTLEHAWFQNYPHYSHTREELWTILNTRAGRPLTYRPGPIGRPASLDE